MTFFQRFLQAWRLASSSDTGSQNKNGEWTMSAADSMALTLYGHTLHTNGDQRLFAASAMQSTKDMVIKAAVLKLFDNNYFSICCLDTVIDLVGARKDGDAYKLLRAMHCVDYSKMPNDLRARIPLLVNEVLLTTNDIDDAVKMATKGVLE